VKELAMTNASVRQSSKLLKLPYTTAYWYAHISLEQVNDLRCRQEFRDKCDVRPVRSSVSRELMPL
jgi:transposase-like protein